MFVLVLTTNLYALTFSPILPSTIQFYPSAPQNIPCFRSKILYFIPMVKVKQSLYRPEQALRDPGGCGSQISRQSAHVGGTHGPPLPPPPPPRKYFCYSFLLETVSTPGRLEGLCQWKIPMTPSVIEPPTFRFVAHCLNQLYFHGLHKINQYSKSRA
jgi:hypothetical protein